MDLDSATKQAILGVLSAHRGEARRLGRESLRQAVNRRLFPEEVSDRRLRQLIAELRAEDPRGAWICASLQGGYFLARDLAELEAHLQADLSRVRRTARRIRRQQQRAGVQAGHQGELPL